MKKSIIFLVAIVFGSLSVDAQERSSVLTAPETWQKEIIDFPIGFAPKIDLQGFEDLRFTPGWSDSTSQEFWSYMFVWYVDKSDPLDESKLRLYFNDYYDGLMRIDSQNEADSAGQNQLNKTQCTFRKSPSGFSGVMEVYDNFFTQEYLTLNIMVSESFCPMLNKQVIRCDISPQPFRHEVWQLFNDVSLKLVCY